MIIKRHKLSGWTRTALGYGRFQITPTDDSGLRVVSFLGAGSWSNLPHDRREDQHRDRVVLVSGDPLPDWAQAWLEAANARSCASGRRALSAMLDDADDAAFGRETGW